MRRFVIKAGSLNRRLEREYTLTEGERVVVKIPGGLTYSVKDILVLENRQFVIKTERLSRGYPPDALNFYEGETRLAACEPGAFRWRAYFLLHPFKREWSVAVRETRFLIRSNGDIHNSRGEHIGEFRGWSTSKGVTLSSPSDTFDEVAVVLATLYVLTDSALRLDGSSPS